MTCAHMVYVPGCGVESLCQTIVNSSCVGIWPCFWDADSFLVPKFKHYRIAGAHVCERIFGYLQEIQEILWLHSHHHTTWLQSIHFNLDVRFHQRTRPPTGRSKQFRPCVNAPKCTSPSPQDCHKHWLAPRRCWFAIFFLKSLQGIVVPPNKEKKSWNLWSGCLISPSSKTSQMACPASGSNTSSKMQWHSRWTPAHFVIFWSARSRSCPLANPGNGKDRSHSSDSNLFRMRSR